MHHEHGVPVVALHEEVTVDGTAKHPTRSIDIDCHTYQLFSRLFEFGAQLILKLHPLAVAMPRRPVLRAQYQDSFHETPYPRRQRRDTEC